MILHKVDPPVRDLCPSHGPIEKLFLRSQVAVQMRTSVCVILRENIPGRETKLGSVVGCSFSQLIPMAPSSDRRRHSKTVVSRDGESTPELGFGATGHRSCRALFC